MSWRRSPRFAGLLGRTRLSGLALACVAWMASTSCVPAAEELPPRGAAGFRTEPSAASRGEPFVTDDGWTVRFEAIALMAYLNVEGDSSYSYSSWRYLWNASSVEDLFVPAIPVGRTRLSIRLQEFADTENRSDLGVATVLADRFRRPADGLNADGSSNGSGSIEESPSSPGPGDSPRHRGAGEVGPSVVFIATGEKDGVVVRLDLALRRVDLGDAAAEQPRVDVRANELTVVPRPVVAEALFMDRDRLLFQDIAAADRDRDGRITAAELEAVRVTVDPHADGGLGASGLEQTLLQLLSMRCVEILGAQ